MVEWRENDAEWYEQRMLYCDLCGRMIAKHYLLAEVEGAPRTFCSEGCETLYRDYWLPERGVGYRPPADIGALYAERMAK
ncbi:MAG: hypothetical protein H0U10_03885 [Chloroflexia bacterium]|nr:hypothetical protein [Chloroflexia bacterium]